MNAVLDTLMQRGSLFKKCGKHLSCALCAISLLALPCASAHALDPLTLILLRLARDKLLSTGIESAAERAMAPVAPAPYNGKLPPQTLGDNQLRRLIDEGFMHLSASQRDEVYESVRRILNDPANAADVPGIIADLALKASGVRQALESISRLSPERKREIAREAGGEYAKLPADARDELTSALRSRLVPLPDDLNALILAEIDRVRVTMPAYASPRESAPLQAAVPSR